MTRGAAPVVLALGLAASAAQAKRPAAAAPAAYVEVVRNTVDAHLADMAACLDPAKRKRGMPEVRLDVQLTILSDGTVLSATRKKAGGDEQTARCMLDKVRAWQFPPPPDRQPVVVAFPIILRLAEPSAG